MKSKTDKPSTDLAARLRRVLDDGLLAFPDELRRVPRLVMRAAGSFALNRVGVDELKGTVRELRRDDRIGKRYDPSTVDRVVTDALATLIFAAPDGGTADVEGAAAQILQSLRQGTAGSEVWLPIRGITVESETTVLGLTLFPKKLARKLLRASSRASSDSLRNAIAGATEDAWARVPVLAITTERAKVEAGERLSVVLDVLNFAAGPIAAPFVARAGTAASFPSSSNNFIVHLAGDGGTLLHSFADTHTYALDERLLKRLGDMGLAWILGPLPPKHSTCQSRLLTAMQWHSRGLRAEEPLLACVMYATAAESLLMNNEKEGVSERLAERGSFIATTQPKLAEETFGELKKLYNARSQTVHAGKAGSADRYADDELASKASYLVRMVILGYLLRMGDEGWTTPEDVAVWCQRRKFQGPSADRRATAPQEPATDTPSKGSEIVHGTQGASAAIAITTG